jgi:hypothetical protein
VSAADDGHGCHPTHALDGDQATHDSGENLGLAIALRAVERRMIYEVSEGPARFSCNWLVKTGREAVEHSAAAV